MMEFNKIKSNFVKKAKRWGWGAVIGIIAAFSVGIIVSWGIESHKAWVELCSGVVGFLFGFFGTEILMERMEFQNQMENEREDFLNRMEEEIDSRMKNLIQYSAFYTENNKLEEVLTSLHNTKGKNVWIISKFIAKKLGNDFVDLKIVIKGHDYSELSKELYPECTQSILLTSPFTLKEWFYELNLKPGTLKKIEEGNDEDIKVEDIVPPHQQALIDSPANTKKRLIILPRPKEDALFCDGIKWIDYFSKVNKNVDIRLVYDDQLESAGIDMKITDPLHYDYAFFDDKILLRWEKPTKEKKMTDLVLFLVIPEEYKPIHDLFNFKENRHILTTLEQVKENCVRAKKS